MSQNGSTTRTVASLGSSTDSTGGGSFTHHKKEQRNKQRKIVRILTVVAYILSVSTVALVLSAYYLLIWEPTRTDHQLVAGKHGMGGKRVTDVPYGSGTTSHHYSTFSRNSYSSSAALKAVTPHSISKMRRSKPLPPQALPFHSQSLPTPQALVHLDENDQQNDDDDKQGTQKPSELQLGLSSPASTSTPERAPASAPQQEIILKTTPNLLMKLLSPTTSPPAI